MGNEDKLQTNDLKKMVPGLYEPQQNRSQKAMLRVLFHFNKMLKSKSFSEIQITAISKAAKVGVGTIYFRFANKDSLLVALADKIVREEIEPSYHDFFSPDSIQKKNLQEFLFAYFKATANVFIDYRYLIKPLTLISREASDPKIPEYIDKMNSKIIQKLKKNITTLSQFNNPSISEKAIEFALLWAGASLREAFLYNNSIVALNYKDQYFLMELSKGITKYLESME
jgi:AcrR family transcriptional regulator